MTVSALRIARCCAAGALAVALAATSACSPAGQPPPGSDAAGSAAPNSPAAVPRTPHPIPAAPAPALPAVGDIPAITQLVNQAIAAPRLPGAVVQVGHAGEVVLRRGFGERKLAGEPGLDGRPAPPEPMTVDTVFDLASLTKILATTTAVLQLYERGLVHLDDLVQDYLPEFNAADDPVRARVTLRMLLTHTSGIGGDLSHQGPWGLTAPDKADGIRRALTAPLELPPGEVFHYSDIGFIILGTLVEQITGQPLDEYVQAKVFDPLQMTDTRYLPAAKVCGPHQIRGTAVAFDKDASDVAACPPDSWSTDLLARIAPTALDEDTPGLNPDFGRPLRGTVHDPTARRMGGVAGSAGVFSTADDAGRYAQALLDRLAGRPSAFPLQRSTLELMTTPQQPGHHPGQLEAANAADRRAVALTPNRADPLAAPRYPAIPGQNLRGLGWDIDTPHSRPRGVVFPIGSFGHTGFTGVTMWIDPGSDTYVIVLANVIHQRGGPPITTLSGDVASAAAQALGLYGS